ncbi:MAG: hypothetical protein O7G83_06655, partial [Proteobacteria bacterium]|nr:hypothetical protein [Pseudomonadota bacterium]
QFQITNRNKQARRRGLEMVESQGRFAGIGGKPMRKRRAIFSLICSLLILTGCGTFENPGAPKLSFDVNKDIMQLEEHFSNAASIEGYYKSGQLKTDRNKFIIGRLVLINIHYIEFIRKFAVDKAQLDSAIDITTIGVDLAITLAGGASTKAILGAISAGLTSTKITIDKNFFQEKTVPVLVGEMNARRKEMLIPIIQGMVENVDVYRFEQAVIDLQTYYEAGTFIGALQSIQKDSGKKETEADEEIEEILEFQRQAGFLAPDAVERTEKIIAKIQTLSESDAIALSTQPPTEDVNSELAVRNQDPEDKRFRERRAAIITLVTRARTDARTEGNLAAWERVLGL